ncbi:chloride channel protein [Neisseria shayeganii]
MYRQAGRISSRIGKTLSRKIKQTKRLSRKTAAFALLLAGAALVALVSLGFARLADYALELNQEWTRAYPWAAVVVLPAAMMLLVWFTRRYAPYTAGSGIPQVLAALSLPHGAEKNRLVALGQTLLKIPLTFLGMLAGASIGREGPSVQVGAAVMAAWGGWCRKHDLAFKNLRENDLLAAGAAGGLAAAFNAPLAGVVFAIEELGRAVALRWERQIFIGVLAAGFILVAIEGNNTYFKGFHGRELASNMLEWVLVCAAVCGVAGGLFARFLSKGADWLAPRGWRSWMRRHPVWLAGVFGLLLAALGLLTQGETYGTGYEAAAAALRGNTDAALGAAGSKWAATVISYWAGIPGGIFTPSLTIGALIGVHVSQLSGLAAPAGVLALLCMAAFLAAATQSPLTASVVVMEMTGSQSLLFWMLIASIAASVISRQFCPQPFYHFAAARFRQRVREEVQAGKAESGFR